MNEPNPENSSASVRGETVNAHQCHGSAELLHSQELLCPAPVNPQLLCLLEVSAGGSTGVHSLLRPIWGRAKGKEQRKRQKWKEPHMGSDPAGALCRG